MRKLIYTIFVLILIIGANSCTKNQLSVQKTNLKLKIISPNGEEVHKTDSAHTFVVLSIDFKTRKQTTSNFTLHTSTENTYNAAGMYLGEQLIMGEFSGSPKHKNTSKMNAVVFCIPNIEKHNINGIQFKNKAIIPLTLNSIDSTLAIMNPKQITRTRKWGYLPENLFPDSKISPIKENQELTIVSLKAKYANNFRDFDNITEHIKPYVNGSNLQFNNNKQAVCFFTQVNIDSANTEYVDINYYYFIPENVTIQNIEIEDKKLDATNFKSIRIEPALNPDSLGRLMVAPVPIGGINAINKELKYPSAAKEKGISGIVWVKACFDETGKVLETRISKSAHTMLNKEAIRVIKTVKWKPGKNHLNESIPGWANIPVSFYLD